MSKVLIIDDSETSRAQMELLVSELNLACVSVGNGREALDMMKSHQDIDLVITDIFMPEMDGIETIEKISEGFPQARIIAVSAGGMGMSGTGMLEIAAGMGARAVLNKPFMPDDFKRTVSEALA